MTLKVRRTLLIILLVPAVAALAGGILTWVSWSRGQYPGNYTIPSLTSLWWGAVRFGSATDLLWSMAGLSFMVVAPLGIEIILKQYFSRSPSPEIFFLRLFLLTLPLQAVRLMIPLALNGSINVIWAESATRIAWFAHLLGIMTMMNIGLYSSEIPFRRSGAVMGASALAVLAIAVMVPLDGTQPLGNLLIRTGADTALSLICVTMEGLAVLALVGTAFTQGKNRYYLLASMLLLIVAGADMIFFVSRPLLIPGAVLMITGVAGFAREIRKIYLWV